MFEVAHQREACTFNAADCQRCTFNENCAAKYVLRNTLFDMQGRYLRLAPRDVFERGTWSNTVIVCKFTIKKMIEPAEFALANRAVVYSTRVRLGNLARISDLSSMDCSTTCNKVAVIHIPTATGNRIDDNSSVEESANRLIDLWSLESLDHPATWGDLRD